MLVLLTLAAVAAAELSLEEDGFTLEVVVAQFGPLEPGLDGCSDFSFLVGEGWHFGGLLLCLVGVLAGAGFRGVAFGVVARFVRLFLEFGFEEIKRLIHVCQYTLINDVIN